MLCPQCDAPFPADAVRCQVCRCPRDEAEFQGVTLSAKQIVFQAGLALVLLVGLALVLIVLLGNAAQRRERANPRPVEAGAPNPTGTSR
jgi:hypothetical protein